MGVPLAPKTTINLQEKSKQALIKNRLFFKEAVAIKKIRIFLLVQAVSGRIFGNYYLAFGQLTVFNAVTKVNNKTNSQPST